MRRPIDTSVISDVDTACVERWVGALGLADAWPTLRNERGQSW